jgi:hypothetical protein
MQAVLGPDHLPQTQWGKQKVSRMNHPIPNRHYYVLALHLKGLNYDEISELSGYAISTIASILKTDAVIQVRQQLLAATQDEFEALFSKVVASIREALDYGDLDQKLAASEKWLKAHGKYSSTNQGLQVNLTAEDIVVQILNQKASNE